MINATPSMLDLMQGMSVTHLRFTVRTLDTIRLDGQPGSAIRGLLYNVLSERFCPHDNFVDHHTTCPVCWLMAQEDPNHIRGKDLPRPIVIRPPKAQVYKKGESFQIEIGLIGESSKLFSFIVSAAIEMGNYGLGKGRGRFELIQIEEFNPIWNATRLLNQDGKILTPRLQVTALQIHSEMPEVVNKVTINLITPTRLIYNKKLMKIPNPTVFIGRLLERTQSFACYYAQTPGDQVAWKQLSYDLIQKAATWNVIQDKTEWVEAFSGSRRHDGVTPISGLVGKFTMTGDLTAIYPWLLWGQSLHVGKNAVKGNGWYTLTCS